MVNPLITSGSINPFQLIARFGNSGTNTGGAAKLRDFKWRCMLFLGLL